MVAWLSHAGTLIRAAPEHLRMATPLESMTFDTLSDAGLLKTKDMAGSRYVDLGMVPTPVEERHASHMQIDEPPPEPPVSQSSSSSQGVPGMSSGAQRPQGIADRSTDVAGDSSSSSSSSSSRISYHDLSVLTVSTLGNLRVIPVLYESLLINSAALT